ncbi:MAG: helix-turn-helix domain-containing protein [Salinibacterium sp.]|nr:helix-turn-helix domain-containing protein [Salinibacterium sp.]
MIARRPRSQVKTLSSLSRINLLHELQLHGSMTVTELATATGLHHNTAREHLHCLIDAGFVRAEPIPRTSKGRPKILYRAANRPDDPAREARLHAADIRTERFRRLVPIREIRSDHASLNRQLDVLDDHLDQCGFDADINPDASLMTVHACPFSDLARENPQVCQVHFALVKDALELTDGPLDARELHPFSGVDECTLDLESPPRAIP